MQAPRGVLVFLVFLVVPAKLASARFQAGSGAQRLPFKYTTPFQATPPQAPGLLVFDYLTIADSRSEEPELTRRQETAICRHRP